MALIVILALLIRIPLFNQSLWLDEAIQALALRGDYGSIMGYALSDFQPPLYHFIGLVWTKVAGYSEIALRVPSLIAGLLTVVYVYKTGLVVGNKKTAVAAGLVAATNPLFVYYSQEGRTYMMTAFFAIAAVYYLLRLLKYDVTKKDKILFGFFTILMVWSSYLSWFFALTIALYLLYKKRWDIFAILVVSCATLILWVPSLIRSLTIGMGDAQSLSAWGKVVGGISLKAVVLTWVKWTIGRISFENNLVYGGIIAILGIGHTLTLWSIRKEKNIHILALLLLGGLVLTATVSFFIPAYSYTRVLFLLPLYLVILSSGLTKVSRYGLMAIMTVNLIFCGIYFSSPRFHKEDWRAAAAFINNDPSLQAVLPSLDQDPPLRYYGLTHPALESTDPEVMRKDIAYIKYVEEIYDPQGVYPKKWVEYGYTLRDQKVFPGLQLDLYTVQ